MIEPTSRTICLYGASGVGKSAQAARFARYVYETTGRVTRAIISDLGSSMAVMGDEIRAGIIEPWWIGRVKAPAAIMRKLSRGAWPIVSGKETLKLEEPTEKTWKEVGGYINDSGTEIAESILSVDLRGSGVKVTINPSYELHSEGETFYGSNESYYGFTQDEIVALIRSFAALPVPVLWTFGEQQGVDEEGGSVLGPETVGKARRLTGKLPKKFGDTLHLEQFLDSGMVDPLTKKPSQIPVWRTYFVPHLDPHTGMMYPAKPRVPPVVWPELLKRWSGGFLTPTIQNGEMVDGLDSFLRFEDDLAGRGDGLAKWKAGVDSRRGEGKK